MHSLYLEPELWESHKIEKNEFLHGIKVLRMKVGQEFFLFNGKGKKALCKIENIEKKHLSFSIKKEEDLPAPKNKIILAAAWTKAARRGFLLEKAVELEASALWIWKSKYSQFPLPEENSTTYESFQQQLIAGVKQCENPFMPELKLISSQKELIKNAETCQHFHVLTTDSAPHILPYSYNTLNPEGKTLIVIGPEGGFSPEEIEIFSQNKYQFFTLGQRILRYETAAVLALGLHFWQNHVGN